MVYKIIYIGNITTKFFYPILCTLTSVVIAIIKIFLNKFEDELALTNKPKYGKHEFIYLFIMYFAETTSLVLYYIQQKRLVRENKIKVTQNNKSKFNINIFALIILASFLDLFNCICDRLIDSPSHLITNIFKGIIILFVVGLCYLILHIKYYFHHAFAVGIIFLGLAIDSYVNHEFKDNINIYVYIFITIFNNLFEALIDVLEKYIMEKKYVDPLLMLGGEGVVGMITVGICFLFVGQINCGYSIQICDKNSVVDNISYGFTFLITHYKYLLTHIILYFFLLAYNIFRVLTNYHYSPAHRIIPKTFKGFILWLLFFIPFFSENAKKDKNIIIGECIGYLFQMFGVLMFVEVLILGICGLNNNIESEITKREKEEFDTRKEGLLPFLMINETNDEID